MRKIDNEETGYFCFGIGFAFIISLMFLFIAFATTIPVFFIFACVGFGCFGAMVARLVSRIQIS